MTTDLDRDQAFLLDPDVEHDGTEFGRAAPPFEPAGSTADQPPRPINWNLLSADEAEAEWLDLNAWVRWLRTTYGLPPAVLPPFWHRHNELIWELSALHTHWLNAYDVDGSPSAPVSWHRDFADTRNRLREWVSTSGTRVDRDRPTRVTTWPGEEPADAVGEVLIDDREADFVQFVIDDVTARHEAADRIHPVSRPV